MRVIVYSSVVAFLVLGCSAHPADPQINMKAPTYVDELPPRPNENVISNP